MSVISDSLLDMYSNDQTIQAIFAGKKAMQLAFASIIQANAQVQALVDNNSFQGINPTLMAALNAAWTALKTCQTTMQAANIQEVINWTA